MRILLLLFLFLSVSGTFAAPKPVPLDPSTLARLAGITTSKVNEIRIMQEMAKAANARIATYGGTSREILEFTQNKVDELGSAAAYEKWIAEQDSFSLLDWHRLQSDLDFMLIPEEGSIAELSRERLAELKKMQSKISEAFPTSVFYKKMDVNIPQEFYKKFPVLGDHLEPVSNVAISQSGFERIEQLEVDFGGGKKHLGEWGLEQYARRALDFRFLPGTDPKDLGNDTPRLLLKMMRWMRYLSENPEYTVTPETKQTIRALVDHLKKAPDAVAVLSGGDSDLKIRAHGPRSKIIETLEKLQLYARDSITTRKLLEEYGVADLVRAAGIGAERLYTPLYPRSENVKVPQPAKTLGEDLVIHHRTSLSAAQNISSGALWISDGKAIIQGKATAAAMGPGLYGAPKAESLSYGDFYAQITLDKNAVEGIDFTRLGNWFVLHTSDAIQKNTNGSLKIAPMSIGSLTQDLRGKLASAEVGQSEKASIVRALAVLLHPETSKADEKAFREVLAAVPEEMQMDFLLSTLQKMGASGPGIRQNPEFFRWIVSLAVASLEKNGSPLVSEFQIIAGALDPIRFFEDIKIFRHLRDFADRQVPPRGDSVMEISVTRRLGAIDWLSKDPSFSVEAVSTLLQHDLVPESIWPKLVLALPHLQSRHPDFVRQVKKGLATRSAHPAWNKFGFFWDLAKELPLRPEAGLLESLRPALLAIEEKEISKLEEGLLVDYFRRPDVLQNLIEEMGTPDQTRYLGLDAFLDRLTRDPASPSSASLAESLASALGRMWGPKPKAFLEAHMPKILARGGGYRNPAVFNLWKRNLPHLPQLSGERLEMIDAARKFIATSAQSNGLQNVAFVKATADGIPESPGADFLQWWKDTKPVFDEVPLIMHETNKHLNLTENILFQYFSRENTLASLVKNFDTLDPDWIESFARLVEKKEFPLAKQIMTELLLDPENFGRSPKRRELFFRVAQAGSLIEGDLVAEALGLPWSAKLSPPERVKLFALLPPEWMQKFPWDISRREHLTWIRELKSLYPAGDPMRVIVLAAEIGAKQPELKRVVPNLVKDPAQRAELESLTRAERRREYLQAAMRKMGQSDPELFAKIFPEEINLGLTRIRLGHNGERFLPKLDVDSGPSLTAFTEELAAGLNAGKAPTPREKFLLHQFVRAGASDWIQVALAARKPWVDATVAELKAMGKAAHEMMVTNVLDKGAELHIRVPALLAKAPKARKNLLAALRADPRWHLDFIEAFVDDQQPLQMWAAYPWDPSLPQEEAFLAKFPPVTEQAIEERFKSLRKRINASQAAQKIDYSIDFPYSLIKSPKLREEAKQLYGQLVVYDLTGKYRSDAAKWKKLFKAVQGRGAAVAPKSCAERFRMVSDPF